MAGPLIVGAAETADSSFRLSSGSTVSRRAATWPAHRLGSLPCLCDDLPDADAPMLLVKASRGSKLDFVPLGHLAADLGGVGTNNIGQLAAIEHAGAALLSANALTLILDFARAEISVVVAPPIACSRIESSGLHPATNTGAAHRSHHLAKVIGHAGTILLHVGIDIHDGQAIDALGVLLDPSGHLPVRFRLPLPARQVVEQRRDRLEMILRCIQHRVRGVDL